MSYDIGVGDLLAMKDVAEGLSDVASTLSAEQAVTLLAAAEAAHKALGDAIAFLKSRAIDQIEQPILVGRTAWSKAPTYKKRPDQELIRATVVATALDEATDHATGEIDPREAVVVAVRSMETLYVSPSTVPKVGWLKDHGLTAGDVTKEEHTGYELKKVDL